MTENRRRALAESYFELGNAAKAEALYGEWLKADPQWGWGWIGWSDCYRFTHTELMDLTKSEQLLLEGFAIPGVRDIEDLADRLTDLYESQGRSKDAKGIRQRAETSLRRIEHELDIGPGSNVLRQKTTITFEDDGLPLSELPNLTAAMRGSSGRVTNSRQKVGRNDPCPCGSGKKFKKCCGAHA